MAYSEKYDSSGVESYTIPSFTFQSGETIPVRIAYRSHNSSSPKKFCVPTCYGGLINETLAFNNSGGALASYHVIVVAMLGNGESSSPSNTPDFPKILDYRDQVHAQHELLSTHLKIEQLDGVLGFSMGGQQAYYWACTYGDFVKNAIVIASSAQTSGHNYAFLTGPIAALENSTDFADGQYRAKGVVPSRGLTAFGHSYCAWLTSTAWYREQQYQKLGFETAAAYVESQSKTMLAGWDADDALILAKMWQAGDVGVFADGDAGKALAGIKCNVLVMPSRTDQYFPPEDSEIEVKHLQHGELAVIETVWGHIAGGGANAEDTEWMDGQIAKFLSQG
ncbi:MAG: hypothetical protein Q9195_005845 [Heterodermia aff. obscurata]